MAYIVIYNLQTNIYIHCIYIDYYNAPSSTKDDIKKG